MSRTTGRPWLALALLAGVTAGITAAAGCSKDDPDHTADNGTVPGDGGEEDQMECRRPPLSLCEPPGTRAICPNHWYCPGCNCSGPFKVAACSLITQDCRWFCTGCYPAEYVGCNDTTAPPAILGRCGYCFHNDAGVEVREDCDRLNAILDAKSPVAPKDAEADQTPEDAGTAH